MADRHATADTPNPCKIKVQILCGEEIAMGPGKADLLETIAREGSISAAGRALGMSYRRTWLLVDTMNRCWELPLVETSQGGRQGGGARLTEHGTTVLAQFRLLQASLSLASECKEMRLMTSMLRKHPASQQSDV